ncbi:MAG: serpin family protein [Bacteroidetes bacterium]|nr:serpin family protein [Bacteroidota bacterium]
MNKYRYKAIIVMILIFIIGSGCQLWGAPEPDDTIEILKSDIPRDNPDSVSLDDILTSSDNVNSFAVSLYNQISNTEGNILFSPYSIHIAMAMTYAGARNQTEQEMAETLLFTLGQEGTHYSLNALDSRLVSVDETDTGSFLFRTANSIWGQTGMPFSQPFLDILAGNYGAGLRLLDFASQPQPSRLIINDWVAEQTEDKIQDLLPSQAVTSDTRMVLTNAVYFKAAWGNQFEISWTTRKPFYLLNDTEISVSMMNQEEQLGYAAGTGWTAVELPYVGYSSSMVVVVPDDFVSFEQNLTSDTLHAIVESLSYTTVNLTLPRFSFTKELALNDTLAAMGMPTAFSDSADFTGMSVGANLAISDVRHKAFIDVNEEGTEAAAATAVGISLTSLPPASIPVDIDRPFIFFIRDMETGTLLFLGRVVNPNLSE